MTDASDTTEPDLKRVGTVVRERRKAAGKTAGELAEQVGISRQHLWNIESGTFRASRPVYKLLASALELDLEQLVGEQA